MNVQFDWPADLVSLVKEKARQRGQNFDAYVFDLISRENETEAMAITEEEKRRQRAEAVAAIRELRKQVKPDPEGWTSQDYIKLGRR